MGRHGWTIDTLREHVMALLAAKDLRDEQRFEAQTSAINAALLAARDAVNKAEAATERRFAAVNEFRQALDDVTRRQVSTERFDSVIDAINARLRELAARVDRTEGSRGGIAAGWSYLIAAAGVVIAVVSIVTR